MDLGMLGKVKTTKPPLLTQDSSFPNNPASRTPWIDSTAKTMSKSSEQSKDLMSET